MPADRPGEGTALSECPLKVLLVSEQVEVVGAIAGMLRSPGYEVASLPGSELGDAGPAHVILLDVEGSPAEGEQLLGRLRHLEATRETPVLLLTSREEIERWLCRMEEGLIDYLSRPFTQSELVARITLARRTRTMLDEARQKHRRLEQLSITDSLTGLYNGWYLQHRCREEVARAKRHQHPISCLMVDVDNFKSVNDRHGHPAGNAVLRELGRLLKANTRASDIVGRYGGEEFLLILTRTNRGEALVLAERLRKVVEDHSVRVCGTAIAVTVSVGVATFPDEGIVGHETLVRQADRALYQAKLSGRNRVVAS